MNDEILLRKCSLNTVLQLTIKLPFPCSPVALFRNLHQTQITYGKPVFTRLTVEITIPSNHYFIFLLFENLAPNWKSSNQ
eukprot:snap_masked-scaffold_78-processed-gene-0.42-mRNA-1 protein AED:1.00 eAED:1.00 QI:0/0/0/0/1/1/2/0/79